MKKNKCIILLIMFVSLAAFGGKVDAPPDVTISVPFSVSSIPLLDLNGSSVGDTRVSVSVFQDHSLTLAEFIKGDIDVLMTGFTQGLSAHEGNKNIVHITTVVWGVSSLMTRDKTATTLADLAGKTVIVPFAKSPLDLQLRAILESAKMTDKVRIEYGPPQQAIAMLIAGKTDAIAVPEPFGSDLEAKGSAKRLFTFQDAWALVTGGEKRSPQVSIFVKRSFAESHGQFLKSLLALLAQKMGDAGKNPLSLSAKYADTFHSPKEVVATGLGNTLFDIPKTRVALSLCSDFIVRIGLKNPDKEFYFDIEANVK